MRGAWVLCVACLLVLAPPLRAQGPVIDHSAVACMAAEKFPQLEARIVEPEAIARARVQFRGEGGPWYFVEMKRSGGVFTGVLPKPKKSLKTIHYYIEATDRQFRENRTQEFAASVVPEAMACADGKMMAGVASTASVIVGSPAGAAAVPAGFSPAGVASATGSSATAAGASAGSGGGIGTAATVGIIAGGAAVAGVAVAASSGGDSTATTTVPVAAGPTTTTTLAPAPPPTTLTPFAATGRWVGMSPDGMVVELNPTGQCPSEFDLELNLTSSTNRVTGTATTRLRKVAGGQCSDVLGRVSTYTVSNGTVESNTISFELGTNAAYRFSGTFTATRMTGTFMITEFPESGRFAVDRQ